MNRDTAVRFKNEGNAFFKQKKWAKAIEKYTRGVQVDPTYHVLYSNRSQAYYNSGKYAEAAKDGEYCIKTSPKDFVKGYHRRANALFALRDYQGALATCKKAESNGFRGNRDINSMYSKCAPLAKKQEDDRLSKLTGHAKSKGFGNKFFKAGQYERAIEFYDKVCKSLRDESCSDKDKAILISCLNNRALCYMQQQNYRQVILDTTRSIGLNGDPSNYKAYFRRATALEGIEKYRSALADIRVCTQAQPTWDAANKAQYRLDQAVRTLKKTTSS